ncbi:protein translocase subunit SecD [candidate division WOR-3 bacterium]|nr:protein translocase subunit SecD [candidate division WOR-3 bacterium]
MKHVRLKFGFMLLLVVLAALALWPSFQLHVQMPAQERALAARRAPDLAAEELRRWEQDSARLYERKAGLYGKRVLSLGLDLVGGMDLLLAIDSSRLTPEEMRRVSELSPVALEVIRNRIDQFGVFEPTIQATSSGRILVQLPGVDREQALRIIKQPAYLTMQLVEDRARAYDALKSIDDFLKRAAAGETAAAPAASAAADSATPETPPETGSLLSFVQSDDRSAELVVRADDIPAVSQLLEQGRTAWPPGFEFKFGYVDPRKPAEFVPVYLLRSLAELEGGKLKRAQPSVYRGQDMGLANTWVVEFELSPDGAAQFARVTSRNTNRRLAIVLDGIVRSAPVIREPIPNGRGEITTGDRRGDQAKELSIVLNSGSLPAPVKVVSERSVSASLGKDSIRRGIVAGLIGALAVLLFMIIYYSIGGVLADFALVLNIFLLLAVLAVFRGTLTLPGLAGIALTIGMAVDANVLVFERIREEVRAGKTNLAAVDTGYARAFVTIFDSNATTVITAIALYFIGAGPIRGFAITLTAGLVINVITAVFFTRWIFDWWLAKFSVKALKV